MHVQVVEGVTAVHVVFKVLYFCVVCFKRLIRPGPQPADIFGEGGKKIVIVAGLFLGVAK